jgi:glycosyltransferase involved in cell wall biosynthesis
LINEVNPSVVLVAQGRIESGSIGLLAAKRAGFRTVSYLPMAHPLSVSGKPVALWLRKLVNGYFYRLPDQFITINESARCMLLEQGARDVLVVPNGIEVTPVLRSDRERFRQNHNIGKEEYLVGVIGRIDFRQKGQDFALQAIRAFRNRLDAYRFVFIGEGPDTKKLKAMIAQANLSQCVQVLPWCHHPEKAYAGLDMLLIPSKFEGVPLVMLEAMAHKLPIVASNTDAMAELLPQCWLFPFGDHHALVDRLIQVRHTNTSPLLESHRKQITEQFTTDKFCTSMTAAILGQTAVAVSVCGRR